MRARRYDKAGKFGGRPLAAAAAPGGGGGGDPPTTAGAPPAACDAHGKQRDRSADSGGAGGGSGSGGSGCRSGGGGSGGGGGGGIGGGGGGGIGGASSAGATGGAAGIGGGGRWFRPLPASIAGGDASPGSLGARALGTVLHECLNCRKEFDGTEHTRHLPPGSAPGEASHEDASKAVWHGMSRFCSPSCSQTAIANHMDVDPEMVKIPISPRMQRKSLADDALDSGVGDPTVWQMQQQHRADYLAVDRALKKASAAAAERGASFAAVARLPPPPQGGGLQLAVAARVGVVDGKQDLYGALLATIAVAAAPAAREKLRASLRSLKDKAAAGERSEALSAGGAGAFVGALSLPAKEALRQALAAEDAERASRDIALAAAQAHREDVPAKLFKNRAASLLSLEGELKVAQSRGEDMCARLMKAVEGLGSSDVAKRVDMQLLEREFSDAAKATVAQYERWKLWGSRVPKPNGDAVLIELWMLCTAAQKSVQDFERAASAFLPDPSSGAAAAKRKRGKSRPANASKGDSGDGGGGSGGGGDGLPDLSSGAAAAKRKRGGGKKRRPAMASEGDSGDGGGGSGGGGDGLPDPSSGAAAAQRKRERTGGEEGEGEEEKEAAGEELESGEEEESGDDGDSADSFEKTVRAEVTVPLPRPLSSLLFPLLTPHTYTLFPNTMQFIKVPKKKQAQRIRAAKAEAARAKKAAKAEAARAKKAAKAEAARAKKAAKAEATRRR